MELTSLESRIGTLLPQPPVFLAEDDDEMRAFAYRTLREEGYDVVEAADGRQMLDRMRAVFGGSDCHERSACERVTAVRMQ